MKEQVVFQFDTDLFQHKQCQLKANGKNSMLTTILIKEAPRFSYLENQELQKPIA